MILQHEVLAVAFLTSSMPEKSSNPWRETLYIPTCQNSLSVPGASPFKFPMLENSGPWSEAPSLSPGTRLLAM